MDFITDLDIISLSFMCECTFDLTVSKVLPCVDNLSLFAALQPQFRVSSIELVIILCSSQVEVLLPFKLAW